MKNFESEIYILFQEEIFAGVVDHALCYGHVRSCVINNSFASYFGDIIHASHVNKAECQINPNTE